MPPLQTITSSTLNGAALQGGGGGLFVSQAAGEPQRLPSPGLAAINFSDCVATFGPNVGTPPAALRVLLNAEDGENTAAPGFNLSIPAGPCSLRS